MLINACLKIQVVKWKFIWLLHVWSTKTPVGKAQDELQVSTQYYK